MHYNEYLQMYICTFLDINSNYLHDAEQKHVQAPLLQPQGMNVIL